MSPATRHPWVPWPLAGDKDLLPTMVGEALSAYPPGEAARPGGRRAGSGGWALSGMGGAGSPLPGSSAISLREPYGSNVNARTQRATPGLRAPIKAIKELFTLNY